MHNKRLTSTLVGVCGIPCRLGSLERVEYPNELKLLNDIAKNTVCVFY